MPPKTFFNQMLSYLDDRSKGALNCTSRHAISDLIPKKTKTKLRDQLLEKVRIAKGHRFFILYFGNLAFAYGRNQNGQLAIGDNNFRDVLTRIELPEPMQNFDAGYEHTIALGQSGKLYVAGSNQAQQLGFHQQEPWYKCFRLTPLQVSPDEEKIVQIAAGGFHSLALTESGKVYSWGTDDADQPLGRDLYLTPAGIPDRVDLDKPIKKIVAGCNFSLFLTEDGLIYYYGKYYGGKKPPSYRPVLLVDESGIPKRMVNVIACWNHALFLAESTESEELEVYVWGNNSRGQLGLSDTENREKLTRLILPRGTITVFCSGNSAFAITKSEQVFFWGNNLFGTHLGFTQKVCLEATEVKEERLSNARYISACKKQLVVVTHDFKMLICENDTLKEFDLRTLDIPDLILSQDSFLAVPKKKEQKILDHKPPIVARLPTCVFEHTLSFLDTRSLRALQHTSKNGFDFPIFRQIKENHLKQFLEMGSIAKGHRYIIFHCGRLAYAYGRNRDGQLAVGDNRLRDSFTQIYLPEPMQNFAAGYDHTLALGQSGKLYVAGSNQEHQIGFHQKEKWYECFRLTPLKVSPDDEKIVHVAAGSFHSLALTNSGKVYSWGMAIDKCEHLGRFVHQGTPSGAPGLVELNVPVTKIAAGCGFSLFLTKDGLVYYCGGYSGGEKARILTHLPIADESGQPKRIVHLVAGWDHAMFVAEAKEGEEAEVYVWGSNRRGELGLGNTTTDRNLPARLTLPKATVNGFNGARCGFFITNSKQVFFWGNNSFGTTLGLTQKFYLEPTEINDERLSNARYISACKKQLIVVTHDYKMLLCNNNTLKEVDLRSLEIPVQLLKEDSLLIEEEKVSTHIPSAAAPRNIS